MDSEGRRERTPRGTTSSLFAVRSQPARGIHRRRPSVRSAMPNLEMEMWWELGIRHADFADDLSLGHDLLRANVGAVERAVDRVVAAAVVDDHREAVRSELADVHHAPGGHRGN